MFGKGGGGDPPNARAYLPGGRVRNGGEREGGGSPRTRKRPKFERNQMRPVDESLKNRVSRTIVTVGRLSRESRRKIAENRCGSCLSAAIGERRERGAAASDESGERSGGGGGDGRASARARSRKNMVHPAAAAQRP